MKSRKLVLFTVLFGIAVICSGAPPSASSLREIWQNKAGKCGTMDVADGIYKFLITTENEQVCITKVGADFVAFTAKGSEPKKLYLIIPMSMVTIRFQQ